MPISVQCPNPACGTVSIVSEEIVGRRVKCRQCSQAFTASLTIDHVPGESPATVLGTTSSQQRIGRFEVRGKLGAGAFGIVYRAYDPRLEREVALKVPNAGTLDSPKRVERFLREAKAAAGLRHPHIVPVFDAGQDGGRYFIASAFIEGKKLADTFDETGAELKRAARLVRELAEALAYAHEQGIVHRDVKPDNIMVDNDDRVHLMDFGLAARQDDEARITNDGTILGTPSYMAPEQARGQQGEAQPAADQYSAGVVLYELLTGRVPFEGSPAVVIHNQIHIEPDRPTKWRRDIARDLETICLKALAKKPEERYRSCGALAADLRRWLDDEPITARRLGFVEQATRWARRNKAVAALSVLVALVLVAGAVVSALFAVAARQEAGRADEAAERSRAAERRAEGEADHARTALAAADAERRKAETALAGQCANTGLLASDQGRYAEAALWFARAARLAEGDPQRVRMNRIRARAWSRAAPFPVAARQLSGPPVVSLAFHPGGKLLLLGRPNGDYRLLDWRRDTATPLPGGERPLKAVAWSPDGSVLAIARRPRKWKSYSQPAGKLLRTLDRPKKTSALAFSGNGRYLALGGKSVRVWDTTTDEYATPEIAHPAGVYRVAFNPAGDRLVTAGQDGKAQVFAVPGDGKPLGKPVNHLARPTGLPLLTAGKIGPFLVSTYWDSLYAYQSESPQRRGGFVFPGPLSVVRMDGSGRHVFVGGMNLPGGRRAHTRAGWGRLLETERLIAVGAHVVQQNQVDDATFSPDGQTLYTCGGDHGVGVWSVPDLLPTLAPLEHQADVFRLAISRDGSKLATLQNDGLLRVWQLADPDPLDMRITAEARHTFADMSADGQHLLPVGSARSFAGPSGLRSTRVYDRATGRPAGPVIAVEGELRGGGFAPGGRTVALLTAVPDPKRPNLPVNATPGAIRFVDWKTGAAVGVPVSTPAEPFDIVFRPDGKQAVAVCANGTILVLDPRTGVLVRKWDHPERLNPLYHLGKTAIYAPDGATVFTMALDYCVYAWNPATGKLRYPPIKLGAYASEAIFSPDGKTLAVASRDKHVHFPDPATGEPTREPLAHPDWVSSARFSPDGRHLVTACRDRSVRIWDWREGKLACPPLEHRDEVFHADFTPDGAWVVTCARDATLRIWDARTGKPVAPPRRLPGAHTSARFTPDRRFLVLSGNAPQVSILSLADLYAPQETPAVIAARGRRDELSAGRVIMPGLVQANMSSGEWLRKWQEHRQAVPLLAGSPGPQAAD